jgi:hypothetical protein
MIITAVLAVWEAVVIAVVFAISFRGGLRPYISWADVHYDFSRVAQYPTVFIPNDILVLGYVSWWTVPLSGLSFFCSFSFGEDAVAEYGPWARWVARGFGCGLRSNRGHEWDAASSTFSMAHLLLPRATGGSFNDIRPDLVEASFSSAEEVKVSMYDRDAYYPELKVDDDTVG